MNLTGFPCHDIGILGIDIGINAINLDDAVATIDHWIGERSKLTAIASSPLLNVDSGY